MRLDIQWMAKHSEYEHRAMQVPVASGTSTDGQKHGVDGYRWLLAGSAFVCAMAFVVGFALLLGPLKSYIEVNDDPAAAVQFVSQNYALLYSWNLLIYVVFGVALLFLNVGLFRALEHAATELRLAFLLFAGVWVAHVIASGMVANVGLSRVVEISKSNPEMAQMQWLSIYTTKIGLGGSNELVGGLWVLVVSWASWQSGAFSRRLSLLGAVAGLGGCLTLIPSLKWMGAVFGLSLIVWFFSLAASELLPNR